MPISPLTAISSRGPHRHSPAAAGFTLIELLVAILVLASGFLMAAVTGTSTMNTMVHSLTMSDQESRIDEDVATIRGMAERYTWCSGSGSFLNNGTGCKSSAVPLSSDYYFPNNPPAKPGAEPSKTNSIAKSIKDFTTACDSKKLTEDFIKGLPAFPTGLNLIRSISLQDSNSKTGEQNHVVRVTYSSTDPAAPVEREALILPTVAAWCP